jgi:hypothetical protein
MLVSGAFEFIAWSLAEGQAVAEMLVWFTPFRLFTEVLLSVGFPIANAPDVLQPCALLYYP